MSKKCCYGDWYHLHCSIQEADGQAIDNELSD
jgi:hypothetical protein